MSNRQYFLNPRFDPRDATDLEKTLNPADLAPIPDELLEFNAVIRSAVLEAREWLEHYLSNGAKPAPQLLRAAHAHGHSLITLRRAKRNLRVVSFKPARDEPWTWALPQPQRPDNKGD